MYRFTAKIIYGKRAIHPLYKVLSNFKSKQNIEEHK